MQKSSHSGLNFEKLLAIAVPLISVAVCAAVCYNIVRTYNEHTFQSNPVFDEMTQRVVAVLAANDLQRLDCRAGSNSGLFHGKTEMTIAIHACGPLSKFNADFVFDKDGSFFHSPILKLTDQNHKEINERIDQVALMINASYTKGKLIAKDADAIRSMNNAGWLR
jgi:hypothetical protein